MDEAESHVSNGMVEDEVNLMKVVTLMMCMNKNYQPHKEMKVVLTSTGMHIKMGRRKYISIPWR